MRSVASRFLDAFGGGFDGLADMTEPRLSDHSPHASMVETIEGMWLMLASRRVWLVFWSRR